MKKWTSLILFLIIITTGDDVMSDIPLHSEVLRSVVYIKNSFDQVGSGFLISKEFFKGKTSVFLITNKHVLKNKLTNEFTQSIAVRFYLKQANSSESKTKWITFPLFSEKKELLNRIFLHPNDSVDIAAILITDILVQHSDIDPVSFPEDTILTKEKMEQEVINAGENVFILGYPAGIFSASNFLPLVKSGVISSSTDENLVLSIGGNRIEGKIFLVEAALFGGNSGGPVLIKPRWRVTKDKKTLHQSVSLGEGLPLSLLGVNSGSIQLTDKVYTRMASQLAKVSEDISSVLNSGELKKDDKGEYIELKQEIMLNIVFSAEYIRDLFAECEERFNIKEVQTESQNVKTIPAETKTAS